VKIRAADMACQLEIWQRSRSHSFAMSVRAGITRAQIISTSTKFSGPWTRLSCTHELVVTCGAQVTEPTKSPPARSGAASPRSAPHL
jgi:hypothetical protein